MSSAARWRLPVCLLLAALVCGCAAKHVVYKRADPAVPAQLPRDNYAHRDFRTEWWYFTGQLTADNGREYAFEITFFKRRTDQDMLPGRVPVRNFSNPAHLAHFAIIDETAGTHQLAEKRSRDHIDRRGNAGALEDMLYVWNDGWWLKGIGDEFMLKADMPGYDLTLLLSPNKPPVLHGQNGYFAKGEEPGRGTYYISYTNLEAEGVLFVDGEPLRVRGRAWHDHEYGSHQLEPEQRGWDWFSLRLDNDVEIMLYMLTLADGGYDALSKGTLVPAQGDPMPLTREQIQIEALEHWTSPDTGATYPTAWRVQIPSQQIDLEVRPRIAQQEMLTRRTKTIYWEGCVRVSGLYRGQPITGRGFVELTGYVKPLKWLTRLEQGGRPG